MSANRTGHGKSLDQDFRDMDALPHCIKQVFWRAPLNIGTMSLKELRDLGVAKARAQAIVVCARYAARQNLKTYGKDHPCQERLQKAMAIGQEMAR
jgi:hypothetical protein